MQAWADFLAGDLPDNWRWREPGQDEDISEEKLFELKYVIAAVKMDEIVSPTRT